MIFDNIKKIENEQNLKTYKKYDIAFTHGKGCKLYDSYDNEYTDFLSGIAVNCLGYGNKELTDAVKTQAGKLFHASNLFYNETISELTQNLLKDSDFEKAFFCNSGAEANEAAIKLARKYFYKKGISRYKFITAKDSFHGRTMGSLALTGQPKLSNDFKPLMPGVAYVPFNDEEALKHAVDTETCAIMLEVVQGEAGVILASPEYLKLAEKLAKEHGILLIIDEVQTGMGRTGKMFGYQHYGIKPDIITLSKSLGGGLPLGAVLANSKLADTFTYGDHGSTFGGNPIACAAANVVVKKLTPEFLIEIAKKGKYLTEKLSGLNFSFAKKPRGLGLMIGLQLEEKINGREVVIRMLKKGFVINSTSSNTLRFLPPYVITLKEIDEMVKALDDLFHEMDNELPKNLFMSTFQNLRNL